MLLRVVAGHDMVAPRECSVRGIGTPARIRSRLVLPAPLRPITSRRSPLHFEDEILEDFELAVALGQAIDGEHDVAGGRRVREP